MDPDTGVVGACSRGWSGLGSIEEKGDICNTLKNNLKNPSSSDHLLSHLLNGIVIWWLLCIKFCYGTWEIGGTKLMI